MAFRMGVLALVLGRIQKTRQDSNSGARVLRCLLSNHEKWSSILGTQARIPRYGGTCF